MNEIQININDLDKSLALLNQNRIHVSGFRTEALGYVKVLIFNSIEDMERAKRLISSAEIDII